MILYIRIFALCALLSSAFVNNSVASVQEIVAVVNDEAISARDFYKRMRLIMVSSGLPNNKEMHDRISPQVIGALINEKIMVQEASRMKLLVSQSDIDNGFAAMAAQNKFSPDKFKAMLSKSGVDVTTVYAQVEAQVAWSKVVQNKLRSKVIVSDRDVDDVLERMIVKVGTKEYLAAEIFLPVEDAKQEQQIIKLAHRLVSEVKSGKAGFYKLAQQFSRSAGAVKGGDMGWLQETQISDEILSGLQSLKKNQVSAPIKTSNGYHILFLRDTRILTEDTVPSRDQIYYNLGAERLEKLQRRYLMDLKATSFIDVRV